MVGTIYRTNFNPEAVAIKFKGNNITYGELDYKVMGYTKFFQDYGLKKGEKVLLSCPNSPEFIYAYFGVVNTGAVIVPLNLLLTVEEITYIIKDSQAKTMIVHPVVLQKLKLTKEAVENALGIKLVLLDDELHAKLESIDTKDVDVFNDENAISSFLYTSGTTGRPKAAMLTHKNMMVNAHQSSLALYGGTDDVFMCVLPMFHVFAFTACILLPLYIGASVVIVETFQPKEVIESLLKEGVTVFEGVPSMYIVLLEAGKANIKFPKLRLAVSGGAPLPAEIFRKAKEILNLPIIEGYGLSEASPVVSFNPVKGVQKEGSIGLPLDGIECKILDENDNEVPTGEVGELAVRGENVMAGYFNQEEETQKTLKNGWLHTGDLGKKDEEGYLYIVDRKKDLVIVGGLNVYPREVEEAIYKYPKVKEAAVIGVEDKLRGESVKAYVVLKEGEECTERELFGFLKERLALYKLPRDIEFTDNLPKSGTGKILKRLLR